MTPQHSIFGWQPYQNLTLINVYQHSSMHNANISRLVQSGNSIVHMKGAWAQTLYITAICARCLMNPMYFLALCRFILGLTFSISFYRKATNFEEFEYSFEGFQILPNNLIRPAAYLILSGELILVGLFVLGGNFLSVAFPLALLMLLIFTLAMLSVIVRKIENPCSCFGATDNLISGYDMLRNGGFMLWTGVGWSLVGQPQTLLITEWFLIGLVASGFVIGWIRFKHILRLMHVVS
jgi:hypothetical protein